MNRLELVTAGNDVERARAIAGALGGTLLCDERGDARLPFRALLSVVTDDLGALLPAADVGAYLVLRRVMKQRATTGGAELAPAGAAEGAGVAGGAPVRRAEALPGAIALYPMVRHPALTHEEADRHWRDRHAPLALVHHPMMTNYVQLSIVHRLHGPEWDGFALCGFDSVEDLEQRFFSGPEGRRIIREDVAKFADGARSPRRLIATVTVYGASSDHPSAS
jgi:uncharacterized protein (TIGR02118 family)